MSDCPLAESWSGCTPENRLCATLGDCPNHIEAALALYPPGSTITTTTGEMYMDIDRWAEHD